MTNWHIDLAFDMNASDPPTDLQFGVVTSTGTPGNISEFSLDDTVAFFIFNITSGGGSNAPVSQTLTSVSGLVGQTTSNPWGGTGARPFEDAVIQSNGPGTSHIFPGGPFPSWQLNGGSGLLQPSLENIGQFQFTFALSVAGEGDPILFGTDPTMIVTSGG